MPWHFDRIPTSDPWLYGTWPYSPYFRKAEAVEKSRPLSRRQTRRLIRSFNWTRIESGLYVPAVAISTEPASYDVISARR